MKRTMVFAKRNLIEVYRDPLSWIFCIAFPIVMLIIMSIVNSAIPKEAGNTLFRIDNLAGGIAIFGQMFVMLYGYRCCKGQERRVPYKALFITHEERRLRMGIYPSDASYGSDPGMCLARSRYRSVNCCRVFSEHCRTGIDRCGSNSFRTDVLCNRIPFWRSL